MTSCGPRQSRSDACSPACVGNATNAIASIHTACSGIADTRAVSTLKQAQLISDRCTTCGAAVDAAITSPACSAAFTHYNATVRCGSCLAASGTLQASIDSACAAQVNNAYRNSVYLPNAQSCASETGPQQACSNAQSGYSLWGFPACSSRDQATFCSGSGSCQLLALAAIDHIQQACAGQPSFWAEQEVTGMTSQYMYMAQSTGITCSTCQTALAAVQKSVFNCSLQVSDSSFCGTTCATTFLSRIANLQSACSPNDLLTAFTVQSYFGMAQTLLRTCRTCAGNVIELRNYGTLLDSLPLPMSIPAATVQSICSDSCSTAALYEDAINEGVYSILHSYNDQVFPMGYNPFRTCDKNEAAPHDWCITGYQNEYISQQTIQSDSPSSPNFSYYCSSCGPPIFDGYCQISNGKYCVDILATGLSACQRLDPNVPGSCTPACASQLSSSCCLGSLVRDPMSPLASEAAMLESMCGIKIPDPCSPFPPPATIEFTLTLSNVIPPASTEAQTRTCSSVQNYAAVWFHTIPKNVTCAWTSGTSFSVSAYIASQRYANDLPHIEAMSAAGMLTLQTSGWDQQDFSIGQKAVVSNAKSKGGQQQQQPQPVTAGAGMIRPPANFIVCVLVIIIIGAMPT
ncbi:Uncharacterized protein PBTT_10346 [Plasmodiophora brassicae]|nr:hypothetical protein PBRA_008166 [Plasmodiophora brassicae]